MFVRQVKGGTTDVSVVIRIIDNADGTPETGVVHNTSGIDLEYRREGAASTDITEASLSALTDAHADGGFLHIGNGYYRLDLPDAACASGATGVLVHGTVTGMVVIGTYLQLVAYDPYDTVRLGLTALPNAAAAAAGGLLTAGGTGNVLPTDAIAAASIAANAITAAKIATDAIDADALADGAITAATFAAGAIDATAIADNAIDAGALAANAITAAKIAADAITAAKIADGAIDAATFAAGAIDAAAIAADAIDASALAADAVTEIQSGLATAAALATVDDFLDTEIADIQSRLPAALVSGRMDSSVGAVAANAITAAAVADGAIDRATFAADTGLQTVRSNTAQAGAAGSVTLDASASATTDFYKGAWIVLTGGTGAGQARLCTAYNGTTKVATIAPNWATNPDNTSTFAVLPTAGVDVELWGASAPNALVSGRVDVSVGAMAAGTVTAAAIATDAIDADALADGAITAATFAAGAIDAAAIAANAIGASELAADAVTEIQAGLATAAALADVQTDTDDIQSRLPAALVSGRIDASVGAVANGAITAAAIATDAIDADALADGAITAATFAAGAIDATAIAADAIGSSELAASAVTEIQSGLATSAEVAGVQSDTNDIQSRLPAALVSGRIDASVGAMAAGVVTAAAVADGAIDRATFAADTGLQTLRSGTAQAGAAGTITLDASASATDDFYNDTVLFLTGGTGAGQARRVRDYVGATKVATVVPNWATNPDNTSTFAVLPVTSAWDETLADHLDSGSTGAALNAAGSAGDPWNTALPGAYGAGTAGNIVGTNLDATVSSRATQASVNTIDDFLDTEIASIQADTDDIQARLPAALVSGRIDASVGAVAANAITAAAIANGAIDAATFAAGAIDAAALAADAVAEIADGVWDEAASGHGTAGTFGQALNLVRSGTAQAGAAGTITLDAGASAADDFYNNTLLFVTGGTGAGQSRMVADYNGTTKVATVNGNWVTTPDNTSVFVILPFGAVPGATAPTAGEVADAVWDELKADHTVPDSFGDYLDDEISAVSGGGEVTLADGSITAAKFAANAITAAAMAADAILEIADGVLDRDMGAGTDSGTATLRTVRQALRLLRNKHQTLGGTLTVMKEDDVTASWTAALTTSPTAEPVVVVDPASS